MKPIKVKVLDQLKKRGFYQDLLRRNEQLEAAHEAYMTNSREELEYGWFVKPGHFYSPLIDTKEVNASGLIDVYKPQQKKVELPGVALNEKAQWKLLQDLGKNSKDLEAYSKRDGLRFRFDNDQFGKTDASVLYTMLRHVKPRKVVEVGSGWSSALMLDLNEFYKQQMDLTFVEPYPDRLYGTLKRGDRAKCQIVTKKVQDVDTDYFKKLNAGDVLFIDSSHVSKTGSDVNHLYFEVLPRLKKGVFIHVHDIFYPFEYPRQWVVDEKRNWNEIYMLRALLTGSNMFEVVLWTNYLMAMDKKRIPQLLPKATDFGGSIWLQKTS